MYVELLPFGTLAKRKRLEKQELYSFVEEIQKFLNGVKIELKEDRITAFYRDTRESVDVLLIHPVDDNTVEVEPTPFLIELEKVVREVPFTSFGNYLMLTVKLSDVLFSPAGQDYLMRIGSENPKALENLEMTLLTMAKAVRQARQKLQDLNNQPLVLKQNSRKNGR